MKQAICHGHRPAVPFVAALVASLSYPALLKPAAEDCLRLWPVSRRVNKTGTGDDDPTLLDEIGA
jgi:hypothetical protein